MTVLKVFREKYQQNVVGENDKVDGETYGRIEQLQCKQYVNLEFLHSQLNMFSLAFTKYLTSMTGINSENAFTCTSTKRRYIFGLQKSNKIHRAAR